jgi:hypothetical protein
MRKLGVRSGVGVGARLGGEAYRFNAGLGLVTGLLPVSFADPATGWLARDVG